jgi:thiol:disulfide interchange protein DsbD
MELLAGEANSNATPSKEDFSQYGFTGLILLGVLGGLISLIMPCTYPLIPITLTYFIKQAAGSRSHGLLLSSLYSFGIIITFTAWVSRCRCFSGRAARARLPPTPG